MAKERFFFWILAKVNAFFFSENGFYYAFFVGQNRS